MQTRVPIYVVGFDTALRAWRRVLTRRGHMAVSEVLDEARPAG